MKIKSLAIVPIVAVALAATPAAAQNTGDPAATTYPVEQEDDDDFPWGLLGLAGLAGLLGRKRDRDDHHRTTGTNNR